MKLLIHDLGEREFHNLLPQIGEDITVIADNSAIRPCIGCFGCWIKTPGTCVIKDGYQDLGKMLSMCDEMIVISKCMYIHLPLLYPPQRRKRIIENDMIHK
jgi:Multimeric flavodoxin WrbA